MNEVLTKNNSSNEVRKIEKLYVFETKISVHNFLTVATKTEINLSVECIILIGKY